MGLEAAGYINQLIATNPQDTDQRETAADHLRLIKACLLASFPNVGGVVTASDADLSVLAGMASTPTLVAPIPSGTFMLFVQAAAPTGWTLVTTLNDRAIRVTNGGSGGAGGATGGSWTISGLTATVAGHSLSIGELPSHTHGYQYLVSSSGGQNANYTVGGTTNEAIGTVQTTGTGSGTAHTHGASMASDASWRPAYVNAIVCQKT